MHLFVYMHVLYYMRMWVTEKMGVYMATVPRVSTFVPFIINITLIQLHSFGVG